jgi:hypothetical protein
MDGLAVVVTVSTHKTQKGKEQKMYFNRGITELRHPLPVHTELHWWENSDKKIPDDGIDKSH